MRKKGSAGPRPSIKPDRSDLFASIPVILLVVAFYFWTAMSNGKVPTLAMSYYYYPLLGRAFVEGHLYLDIAPAPELLALPDPYDPKQNKGLRLHDASLYKGKYYLYFGPTPAVILFAPWFLLTYSDFPEDAAVALFCSLGFIASTLLFLLLVRDYFPGTPLWLRLACVLSLALADACPFFLRRPDVYETAISCAFFTMQLSLLAFYLALRQPRRALPWLLLAFGSLGAAVGARPTYVLLLPVFLGLLIWLWRRLVAAGHPHAERIFCAVIPIGVMGLLLAWYNYARFDSPFEFGPKYQLAGVYMSKTSPTYLTALPLSLAYYFVWPPHYGWQFPFVHALPLHRLEWPDKNYSLEPVTGLFIAAPISLFSFAVPFLLLRKRDPGRWPPPLTLTLGLLFLTFVILFCSILTVPCPTMRYFVDFCPNLILLGGLMMCHAHGSARGWARRPRMLVSVALGAVLLVGCVNGFFLSFSGYYDYLYFGSPETYAALVRFFYPLEILLKLVADLFGGSTPPGTGGS